MSAPGTAAADNLAHEALHFLAHTLLAVLTLAAIVATMQWLHTDPDALRPKYVATCLALLGPMLTGLVVVKLRPDSTALYTWVAGLLLFAAISATVLDLPTGPGLCQYCTASQKLTRTFFAFQNGSGLLGGDGVLVGLWVPLALAGYALGALIGFRTARLATGAANP